MDNIDELFEDCTYEDAGDADESKSKNSNELDSSNQDNNSSYLTPATASTRRRSHRLSDIAEESVHKTPIEPLTILVWTMLISILEFNF